MLRLTSMAAARLAGLDNTRCSHTSLPFTTLQQSQIAELLLLEHILLGEVRAVPAAALVWTGL